MSLVKSTLEQQLIEAFQNDNWNEAATAITTAIDTYIKSATVTVPSGIPVATSGSAVAQTGATTAPTTGTIS